MNEDNNLVSGEENKEKIITLTSEEDNLSNSINEKNTGNISSGISYNVESNNTNIENKQNMQNDLSNQSINTSYSNNYNQMVDYNYKKPKRAKNIIISILIILILAIVGGFSYVYFVMLNPLKVIKTSINVGNEQIKTAFKGILPNLPSNIETLKSVNKIKMTITQNSMVVDNNIDFQYDYDFKNNKSKSTITLPVSQTAKQTLELYKIKDKNYIKSQLLGPKPIEIVMPKVAQDEILKNKENTSIITTAQSDTVIARKILDKYIDIVSNNLDKKRITKNFSNTNLNNKETLTYILTYNIDNEEFKRLNTKAMTEILKDEEMFDYIKKILELPDIEKDKQLQLVMDAFSKIEIKKNIEIKFYISVFDKNNSKMQIKYNDVTCSIYKENNITVIDINNSKNSTNIKIMPNSKTKQLVIVLKTNDSEYKITYELENEDKMSLSFKIDFQISSQQTGDLKLTSESEVKFNETLNIVDIKDAIKSNTLKPEQSKALNDLLNSVNMFNF